MNDIGMLILSGFGGIILGVFFYGGLWLTVKKMVGFKNPALLFLGSMLIRTIGTMVGFYYLSQGDIIKIALCLVTFILTRVVITKITSKDKTIAHEN